MIRFLRGKNVSRKIFLFLAIVVGSSFVITGAVFYMNDDAAPTFLGKIGSRKISVQEYLQSYRAVLHQAALMYGDQLEKVRPFINFRGEAWDRLLLLDHAKSLRIKVKDQEVVDWIRRQPVFHSAAQQFDPRYYEMVVTQFLRTTPRDFEEEIRQMLTISQLRDHVTSKTTITEEQLRALYAQRTAGRDIVYGYVPLESQREGIEVPEEELRSLFPLVQDRLAEPERIRLRTLLLPKDSPVTEAVKAEPADTRVADLALKHGLQTRETPTFSRLDSLEGLGVDPQALFAAVALPIGQPSDWVETPEGAVKVEVIERTPEKAAVYEEVRERLMDLAVRQKANEKALALMEEIRRRIKDQGAGLKQALSDKGVAVSEITGYRSSTELPGLGVSTAVARTVEGLKDGEVSSVVQMPAGALLVQVLGTGQPDMVRYESEKETFRKEAFEEFSSKALGELMNTLRNKLDLNLEAVRRLFPETEESAAPPAAGR
ncbi:MAG: hypothetical protein MOGMAGMI_00260 [Candidatus Omnitrophica bacterium]|nr:hypothetical protein [Candidatus Omnitrophota bacterium]